MLRLVTAPWGPAKRLRWRVLAPATAAAIARGRRSTPAPFVVASLSPIALLVSWLVGVGCGPSFEAIQEGDLRFAHCDRLDLDPNISGSHRLHCWREWRRVYTYGQTRDRVEYAQRRIAEVVSGDTDPPFELPTGSGRPADASQPAAPNPVNSPPPSVVPLAGTESVLAPGAPEDTSGPGCRSRCEAARAGCAPGCESQPRGCQDCEASLEACLGDCKSPP